MLSEISECILLCEDKQQDVFVGRVLKELGLKNHALLARKYPSGKGSGEQHVLKTIPAELVLLRRRSAKSALIVVLDADTNDTKTCLKKIAKSIDEADVQPIQTTERIAILIPRRNIETWIRCLSGHTVDEIQSYGKLTGHEGDCRIEAQILASRVVQSSADQNWPSSLLEGFAQLSLAYENW